MNDHPNVPRGPADDGELLSAYLDGELDDGATRALESRLEADPELAERLERTREVVEALAGLQATPPEGFADRLRRRLDAEREVPGLDTARSARTGRLSPSSLTTVAAVAIIVAVLGALALSGLPGAGDEAAMETADAPDAAMEPAPGAGRDMALDADDGEVAEGFAAGEEDAAEESADVPGVAVPAEPAVVEVGTELAGDEEARAYLQGLDDAAAFLGMSHDEASQLAPAFAVALRHAEPFSTGVQPDRCLDDLERGEEGPVVAVRVEHVSYAGEDALAYLVASATVPGGPLDRVAGWIIETEGCATRLYSPVTPAP